MNSVFLFLLWPVILVMVIVTHWVKRPCVLWTFVLLPPLFLLSLWWIPFGRDTQHFVWGPALLAMVVSLVSVALRLCIIVENWRRSTPEVNRLRLIKLVRPALVVLIMGALWARERTAIGVIKADSIALARQIQQVCARDGRCPEMSEGWEVAEENPTLRHSTRVVTRIGRQARVNYYHLLRQDEFELVVNYHNVFWFHFKGGVGKDLWPRTDE